MMLLGQNVVVISLWHTINRFCSSTIEAFMFGLDNISWDLELCNGEKSKKNREWKIFYSFVCIIKRKISVKMKNFALKTFVAHFVLKMRQ